MNRLRARAQRASGEDGFTLVELLVVIIIIAILAAIAIPMFLNQRKKAYDAAAKDDLHHLAQFEEIYYTDFRFYGTIAQIVAAEPTLHASPGVTLSVVRYDGAFGYCLSATHSASGVVWFYDSESGGLQPQGTADCPVTTAGVAGDSITG